MHVPDDVERPMLAATIRPHRLALDLKSLQFLWGLKDVDSPEPLPLKTAKRPTQLLRLIANDMGTEIAIRSVSIPFLADFFREVQNNGNWQHMELAGQSDKRLSRIRLDVRRVNDRKPPGCESLAG